MFVVPDLLHFRNNNPNWQTADVTVTFLICVRQWPSSIYSKDGVIPA
jgi:hypothetical protein